MGPQHKIHEEGTFFLPPHPPQASVLSWTASTPRAPMCIASYSFSNLVSMLKRGTLYMLGCEHSCHFCLLTKQQKVVALPDVPWCPCKKLKPKCLPNFSLSLENDLGLCHLITAKANHMLFIFTLLTHLRKLQCGDVLTSTEGH